MAVTPSAAGSELCLLCGFCCDGTLHTHAVLQPDEVAPLRALGLPAETTAGSPRFKQPCPHFRNGACAIYASRPRVCRNYQCALLVRCLASGLAWQECTAIVATAHELLDAIRREAPAGMSFRELLKAISELPDDECVASPSLAPLFDSPVTLTRILALATLLHQHFDETPDT